MPYKVNIYNIKIVNIHYYFKIPDKNLEIKGSEKFVFVGKNCIHQLFLIIEMDLNLEIFL